jgi:hypothetical protein
MLAHRRVLEHVRARSFSPAYSTRYPLHGGGLRGAFPTLQSIKELPCPRSISEDMQAVKEPPDDRKDGKTVHAAAVKADGSRKAATWVSSSKDAVAAVTPILSRSTRNSHQNGRRR